MSTTGVVRKIDDLGRIVIPKEIRRSLGIKVGTALEIFVDDDVVSLKKQSSMNNLSNFAELYVDSVYKTCKKNILVTDMDSVVAAAAPLKKKYLNCSISVFLEDCIKSGKTVIERYKTNVSIIEEKEEHASYVIKNIISNGASIGLVILLALDDDIDVLDEKLVEIAVQILGKHIED